MTRTVHFVCVNYNGADRTREFLRSVRAQEAIGQERVSLVVVDNRSSDADFEKLEAYASEAPKARIVRAPRNLGYFGGLNLGLAVIRRGPEDPVVVGNNDLVFAPAFCRILLAASYLDDVLVVAPDVVSADGYHQNPHCVTRFSPMRKFLLRLYFTNYLFARVLSAGSRALSRVRGGRNNPLAGRSMYIHMGIGACYVLTPRFFEHFSQLDDTAFLYGEEALLAGQLMSVGGRTYYDATLLVRHAESATVSKYPSRVIYEHGKRSFPVYQDYL